MSPDDLSHKLVLSSSGLYAFIFQTFDMKCIAAAELCLALLNRTWDTCGPSPRSE